MIKNTLIALSLTFSAFSFGQASSSKVMELIEVTGSKNQMKIMMGKMIEQYETNFNIPKENFADFVSDASIHTFVERLVPIYQKYYSEEDIDGLLAFYKSPVGKKTLSIMPQLLQESMNVGEIWGREIGEKMMMKLDPEALPPPPITKQNKSK